MSLLWIVDEDGDTVHRLQHEWDGNAAAWREWGTWRSAGDNWSISLGVLWSRWSIGGEYEWNHESQWVDGGHHNYRRQSLTFMLGPWYVGWMRCKPLAAS